MTDLDLDLNLHVQIQSISAWTLERICVLSLLQSVADREGRKCLFIIKCSDKSFEISASDKKKKQEWIQGVFLCSVATTPEKVQIRKEWPAAVVWLMGMSPVSCCLSAIQTCIQQLSLGLLSPHREARLRRKELRQKQQVDVEDLEEKMKQLQAANEHKQQQLEEMRKVQYRLQRHSENTAAQARNANTLRDYLIITVFKRNKNFCSHLNH